MNKLCGISMVRNAVKFDYCLKESILSMLGVCDYVICAYVDSDDGTLEVLKGIETDKLEIIHRNEKDWNLYNNSERLSYITNAAIQLAESMGFQYILYIQADEAIDEKSYSAIWQAIQENKEGFMCNRVNLWKDCYHQLNVTDEKLPCSNNIVRLAKTKYRSIGDAESLGVDNVNMDYLNRINIFHYGFVRDKKIMKQKVIHIQEQVFLVDHDPKLDGTDVFEPDRWFDPKKDLKLIDLPHPKIMKSWIQTRP